MNKLITVAGMIVASTLAFFAHQYVQQNAGLAGSLQPRSHAKILDEMRGYQKRLSNLYKATSEIESLASDVDQCVAGVDECYEELGSAGNVPQSIEWDAQEVSLVSYYLAARFSPTFDESFQDQAQQIIEIRPSHQDAVMARMLVYCKEVLDNPFGKSELRELAREASSYSKPAQGVALYSYVAQELWGAGQKENAEAVLESGMKLYKGRPSRLKLVNQLIDQGHRPPPEPKYTQAQHNALIRAFERSATTSCASKKTTKTRFR